MCEFCFFDEDRLRELGYRYFLLVLSFYRARTLYAVQCCHDVAGQRLHRQVRHKLSRFFQSRRWRLKQATDSIEQTESTTVGVIACSRHANADDAVNQQEFLQSREISQYASSIASTRHTIS
jgi:hypothetical protein